MRCDERASSLVLCRWWWCQRCVVKVEVRGGKLFYLGSGDICRLVPELPFRRREWNHSLVGLQVRMSISVTGGLWGDWQWHMCCLTYCTLQDWRLRNLACCSMILFFLREVRLILSCLSICSSLSYYGTRWATHTPDAILKLPSPKRNFWAPRPHLPSPRECQHLSM
jgi:hypothetical protein